MGERAEAGCQDLQELEEEGHLWSILVTPFLQRAAACFPVTQAHLSFSTHVHLRGRAGVGYSVAVAGVAVHASPLPAICSWPRQLLHLVSSRLSISDTERVQRHAADGHGVGGVTIVAPQGLVP